MSDVTRILSAIEQGDRGAAEQLLPLVYDELRRLAARKLARERPGQTLQARALDQLAARAAGAAALVKLHYFAGLTLEDAADVLGIPHRTAYRTWAFARAWLFRKLEDEDAGRENRASGATGLD